MVCARSWFLLRKRGLILALCEEEVNILKVATPLCIAILDVGQFEQFIPEPFNRSVLLGAIRNSRSLK